MTEKSDALAIMEATSLAAISTALGFPVPPTLAKNVIASIGMLTAAAFAVPTAYLEGWANRVRAEDDAKAKVLKGTAPIALKRIEDDTELAERATLFLGGKMLREQKNREAVIKEAVEHVREQAPTEDAAVSIDEDWLNIFGNLAGSRSDETMRTYFARILSGEIRRPGSFSPATLEVLSRLSRPDAESFQALCALVTALSLDPDFEKALRSANAPMDPDGFPPMVVTAPLGNAGSNGLAVVGFPYMKLCRLQEAGLIQHDLTAHINLPPSALTSLRAKLGGRTISFYALNDAAPPAFVTPTQINCFFLTKVGVELLQIVHVARNEHYDVKIVEWLATLKLGVKFA